MTSFEHLDILLVDDDPMSAQITSTLLAKTKAEVHIFTDASSAIESLQRKNYGLIISDWFMPQINGAQFLGRCRQIVPDIPVLFLTANTDIANAIEMIQAGASDYLTKPISSQELYFKIQRTLERVQNAAVLRQIRHENEILELENKQLVHWRQMYAYKESHQVRQIITLIARTINQAGGFMWLDMLEQSAEHSSSMVTLPIDAYHAILSSAQQLRHVLALLQYVDSIDNMTINQQTTPVFDFLHTSMPSLLKDAQIQCQNQNRQLHYYPGTVPGALQVTIDQDVFQQILHELVINAIKYSPAKSAVTIEAFSEQKPKQQVLVIKIRNHPFPPTSSNKQSSVGIPYEISEQVFDLFYTGSPFPIHLPGERWTDGTGLYIVRRLLQRMGAWIELNNGLDHLQNPPAPFVQFSIVLPLKKE
jgi:DNA-binding response OmpR family regulator